MSNKINFMQTGGFPLELDVLNAMQSDYNLFNDLGHVIGNKSIIKGCVTTGNNVSDGIIFYNGELIKFVGGLKQDTFLIRETTETKEFQEGSVKVVYKNRYAEFGTGIGSIQWTDFKRPIDLLSISDRLLSLEKKTSVFQAEGAMVFWNKPLNEIPTGWQEVVDWKGRIPVGVDSNQIEFKTLGKEGGEKKVTLTEQQMPSHNHTGNTAMAGGHHHTLFFKEYATGSSGGPGYDGGDNKYTSNVNKATSHEGAHVHNLSINNTGNGEAHNNLQPYRTVYFIEFIG